MINSKWFILACLLAVLLVIISCEQEEDISATDITTNVTVETVPTETIESFVASTGTLIAAKEAKIVSELEGRLFFKDDPNTGGIITNGAMVRKGQLIAEIQNPEWELSARVESNKLAFETAKKELDKQEALFKEGGVTEKELNLARKNALDAQYNYEAAQLKIDKMKLKAPFDGILVQRAQVANGSRIIAAFELFTIMDYRQIIVEIDVSGSELARIHIDQPVYVQNYALKNEIFPGKVISVDPAIDPKTRTFKVTILVDTTKLRLRPGMFVKVDVVVESHQNAIVIPQHVIQLRNNRKVVFVVESQSAVQREVETGLETRDRIEIISGLKENERLVVSGYETLKDKSSVKIVR